MVETSQKSGNSKTFELLMKLLITRPPYSICSLSALNLKSKQIVNPEFSCRILNTNFGYATISPLIKFILITSPDCSGVNAFTAI